MSDPDFTLYHFPASFYSQKALCTLYEKGVPFKERLVYFHFGEHHEDWFLRLNPKGKVPVLQDGDKVVTESEEIINYIDKRCPRDTPLVPDISTKFGQDVDRYRKLLDIDVETISFGVMKNECIRTTNLKFPAFIAKRFSGKQIKAHMDEKEIAHQEQIDRITDKELKREFEERLRILKRRNIVTSDVDQMNKILDEQESLFDELEAQLRRTKQNCQSDDYWLCGRAFTAADISATVLMVRLYMLGIDDRFVNSKRPLLCDYKKRLMERSTGIKVREASDLGSWLICKAFLLQFVKKCAVKAGIVLGVLGTGLFIYRKYIR